MLGAKLEMFRGSQRKTGIYVMLGKLKRYSQIYNQRVNIIESESESEKEIE